MAVLLTSKADSGSCDVCVLLAGMNVSPGSIDILFKKASVHGAEYIRSHRYWLLVGDLGTKVTCSDISMEWCTAL